MLQCPVTQVTHLLVSMLQLQISMLEDTELAVASSVSGRQNLLNYTDFRGNECVNIYLKDIYSMHVCEGRVHRSRFICNAVYLLPMCWVP